MTKVVWEQHTAGRCPSRRFGEKNLVATSVRKFGDKVPMEDFEKLLLTSKVRLKAF